MVTKEETESRVNIVEGLPNLFKLTPDQFTQVLDAFTRLWSDCTIVVEPVEEGVGLYTHAPEIHKIKIQGIDTKKLITILGEIMDASQTLLHYIKNKNTMESNLKISKQDADRLTSLSDRLEKEGILHDIDYKFHSATPTLDIRSFNYDVRLLSPPHFDEYLYPCCNINFKITEAGDKKLVSFEMTKTEVKKLIRELQNMEKQIEKAESYVKKVRE